MSQQEFRPDFLFEVSWEICNKIGGIHTAISSRARIPAEKLKDNYILIGPDVWKETRNNPEFTEEPYMFRSWKRYAEKQGIKVKTGRWNVPGNPCVFLVDFTPYFQHKDKILAEFWETFGLDSITGGWNYIEPALFGYAAAQVVNSFYEYNLTARHTLAVHFHEWHSGTGILHLKKNIPQAATVFTGYSTVVGRMLASSGRYDELPNINIFEETGRYGVRAQHSLESLSVAHADVFTTLSPLLNEECAKVLGKKADSVISNGLDFSTLPDEEMTRQLREKARAKVLTIAEAITNTRIESDAYLLLHSGLYDFNNKGTDVFIKALPAVAEKAGKTVVALICLPGNQTGPKLPVVERIHNCDYKTPVQGEFLTHNLKDENNDPVIVALRNAGLNNDPASAVKVIFVPTYLNGEDGVFNIAYHDLLPGFDMTVLPSYYDPWSHTPMESIGLSVPTLSSNLTGFVNYILEQKKELPRCVMAVNRMELPYDEVVRQTAGFILQYLALSAEEKETIRKECRQLAPLFAWENFVEKYCQAYENACAKAKERFDLYKNKQLAEQYVQAETGMNQNPVWKKVFIKSFIPERIYPLQIIAKNLWWSWNYEAQELFEQIDPVLWAEVGRNPILMIESMTAVKFTELEKNPSFLEKLDRVYAQFKAYMDEKPKEQDTVAYFSMEFGLHDTVKIYSGGLGVLAGDYLKEASDSNKPMVGIGLLYRYGYFTQSLSVNGEQVSNYIPQKFSNLPLLPVRDEKDDWVMVHFAFPGRVVHAKVWKLMVGRVPLYLLDTDIEENGEQDRPITHQLYGGDWENRLKQEIVLGIGGVKLLRQLGIQPSLYHCNEGHAALLVIERVKKLIERDLFTFAEATELVKSSTLFTTHTPVPAGHDAFSEDMLRTYLSHYAEKMNIEWKTLMGLGRVNENDSYEKFSMSVLAARLSQDVNGVSRIHGRVSREMFNNIWNGFYPEELHISYVTNGVHFPTWVSRSALELYQEYLDKDILTKQHDHSLWKKIQEVPDSEMWNLRQQLRRNLFIYIRRKMLANIQNRQESPKLTLERIDKLNEHTLTIGFARRFATYKRAHLLFRDLDKLARLVNDEERPIQFIFAGKAHPHDGAGQGLIKRIVEVSRMPQFIGKVVFLEDYDMDLAKMLIQGVDVWLNNPTRPLEASGTSGEKAIMNGVVNCSVLDGWWAEGYVQDAGWALKEERTYNNQDLQDELDAETLYHLFENEIAPAFYDRNKSGIPEKWVMHMKNTIAGISPRFTMRRQLDDYYRQFYYPAFERRKAMTANNFGMVRELAQWKQRVLQTWDNIEVVNVVIPDSTVKPLLLTETFSASVLLDLKGLSSDEVGVEVVFGQKEFDVVKKIHFIEELKPGSVHNGCVEYTCNIPFVRSGVYDYSFRVFPRSKMLKYRQDFPLVKWI